MREILFRGKLKYINLPHQKSDWVYGDYVKIKDGDHVMHCIYGYGEIIPETLGQYTGLTDKNGKRIFEGDKVRLPNEYDENEDDEIIGIIEWDDYMAEFVVNVDGCSVIYPFGKCRAEKLEIIGNIHDNSEQIQTTDKI